MVLIACASRASCHHMVIELKRNLHRRIFWYAEHGSLNYSFIFWRATFYPSAKWPLVESLSLPLFRFQTLTETCNQVAHWNGDIEHMLVPTWQIKTFLAFFCLSLNSKLRLFRYKRRTISTFKEALLKRTQKLLIELHQLTIKWDRDILFLHWLFGRCIWNQVILLMSALVVHYSVLNSLLQSYIRKNLRKELIYDNFRDPRRSWCNCVGCFKNCIWLQVAVAFKNSTKCVAQKHDECIKI